MRPVVGAVHDDGVVGDAQVIQLLQEGAHAVVVVDHDVVVFRLPAPGLAQAFGLGMGPKVHVRGVEPHEERLIGLGLAVDVFRGRGQDLVVDGLHALFGQLAGVFDAAVGGTAEHAPGSVVFLKVGEVRLRGVIAQFRLLAGV